MRPTISEQLAGAARILDEVVAPHVGDANAAEQLGHVVSLLDGVATGWATFLPRLHADARELHALLATIDPEPLPGPPTDVLDIEALDAHHTALRARLAELIPTVDAPAASSGIRAYLNSHVARFS